MQNAQMGEIDIENVEVPASYMATLDKYLEVGPSAAPADSPTAEQAAFSAAECAMNGESSPGWLPGIAAC